MLGTEKYKVSYNMMFFSIKANENYNVNYHDLLFAIVNSCEPCAEPPKSESPLINIDANKESNDMHISELWTKKSKVCMHIRA